MPNYYLFIPEVPELKITILKFEGQEKYIVLDAFGKKVLDVANNSELDFLMDMALAAGFKVSYAPKIGQDIKP